MMRLKIEKVKEMIVKYLGMEHPKVIALYKFIEDYSGIWEDDVIEEAATLLFFAAIDEELGG